MARSEAIYLPLAIGIISFAAISFGCPDGASAEPNPRQPNATMLEDRFESDEPGPNYHHLKPLQWFIGVWETTYELPDDAPGFGRKGDRVRISIEAQWGLNKNVIRTRNRMFINDKLVLKAESILGWDPERKKIIDIGFDSLGGRYTNVTTIVDDHSMQSRQREVKPNGTIGKCTIHSKYNGHDTITLSFTERTVDGKKCPDDPPTHLTRVR